MATEKKLSLQSLPLPTLNQALFSWITLSSVSNLAKSLPQLLTPEVPDFSGVLFSVVLNTMFVAGGVLGLTKSFSKVDYAGLPGLDTNSLALEAGEWALGGDVPARSRDGKYEVATFGGGCFWGTELHYQRIPGVVATCVGYTQGSVNRPNYDQVCSGRTGHTEAIMLIFDPAVCSYDQLLQKLFSTVNPTLVNQVGNDRGTQYRHGVYTHSDAQAEAAGLMVRQLQEQYRNPIVTEVRPASVFWPAEDYHQQYLQKRGQSAEKNAEEKVRCYG